MCQVRLPEGTVARWVLSSRVLGMTLILDSEFCASFGFPAKNYSNGGPDAITSRQGRCSTHEQHTDICSDHRKDHRQSRNSRELEEALADPFTGQPEWPLLSWHQPADPFIGSIQEPGLWNIPADQSQRRQGPQGRKGHRRCFLENVLQQG